MATTRMEVPLSQPWITQDDIDAVVAVLQTPTLSIGPQLQAFERAVADRVGAKHGLGVNSGTSGLHLCLDAIGVGPGDEVITSPFSFVASANCIMFGGGRPSSPTSTRTRSRSTPRRSRRPSPSARRPSSRSTSSASRARSRTSTPSRRSMACA